MLNDEHTKKFVTKLSITTFFIIFRSIFLFLFLRLVYVCAKQPTHITCIKVGYVYVASVISIRLYLSVNIFFKTIIKTLAFIF